MALCFMFPVAEYQFAIPTMDQTVTADLSLVAPDEADIDEAMMQTPGATIEYSQKTSGFRTWPLVVMALLTGVMALVCLFMYKNRVMQMRAVAVAFLLNVVYVFLVFFWAVDAYGKIVEQAMMATDMDITWYVAAYAPIASIVFFVLAHRGIKKDESMVRAADRIR